MSDDLDPDPIAQFNHWLSEAMQQDLVEPNAMILATVDDADHLSARPNIAAPIYPVISMSAPLAH